MPAKQEPNVGLNYGWNGGESGINLQLDENWRAIGALLQLSVVSRTEDVPASPGAGDRYIVPAGATGAWAGLDDKVVRYNESVWEVYTPLDGWLAFVADEDLFCQFNGADWIGAPFLQAANTSFDHTGTSLAAADVQAALEELDNAVNTGGLSDGSVLMTKLADYSHQPATTTGLTFGYRAGRIRVGPSTVSTSAGTLSLAASSTNYVELDRQGNVSSNTTGFTKFSIPLYVITTATSSIQTIEDRRTWMSVEDFRPGINNMANLAYTLDLEDENTVIRCTNSSSITVTVPAESSVNFPVGAIIQIRQVSAGQVTLAPDTGVTLTSPETLKTRKQGSTVGIMKVGADTWDVTGDLEATS